MTDSERERDELLGERERLKRKRDELLEERERLVAERDALKAAKAELEELNRELIDKAIAEMEDGIVNE